VTAQVAKRQQANRGGAPVVAWASLHLHGDGRIVVEAWYQHSSGGF
jgi:hypothetical protein